MPVEQADVQIRILAKDAATRVFRQVGDELQRLGRRADAVAAAAGRMGARMSSVGSTLSTRLTLPLMAVAGASIHAAAQADRYRDSLISLAGGADEAARYLEAIQDASRGTIDETNALAVANRALTFGVVKNAEEMRKLTEIAITLGRAQGLTATQAVSDFTTALGRNSPLILDNLGLTLKLSEAYRMYADQLGKSVDELTEQEKAEAFRAAALEKGMALVAELGGVSDDAASATERMTAELKDAAVALGRELLPHFVSVVDIATDAVAAFNDLDPATRRLVVTLGGVAAAAGPVLRIGGGLLVTVGKLPGLFRAASSAAGEVAAAYALLGEGASAAELGIAGFAAAAAPVVPLLGLLAAGLVYAEKRARDLDRAIRDATKSYGAYRELLRQLAPETEAVDQATYELMSEQERANAVVKTLTAEIEVHRAALAEAREGIDGTRASMAEAQAVMQEMAWLEQAERARAYAAAQREAALVSSDAALAFRDEYDALDPLDQAAGDAAAAAGDLAAQVGAAGQAAGDAAPLFGDLEVSVGSFASALASGIPDTEDMWRMIAAMGFKAGMGADQIAALARAMGVATDAETEAVLAAYQVVEGWKEGTRTGQDLIAVTQLLEQANAELTLAAEAEKEGDLEAAEAHRERADALVAMASSVAEAGRRFEVLDERAADATQSIRDIPRSIQIEVRDQALRDAAARARALRDVLREAREAMWAVQPVGGRGAVEGTYQAGTDYVPQTGLAFLHRGEAVLNPREAALFRVARGQPAEVHYHYHLEVSSALPAQSIVDEFGILQALAGP